MNDQLEFQISMPLLSDESIYSARFAFEIKVELDSVIRMEMFSLIASDLMFPVSSQSLDIIADVALISRSSSNFQAYKSFTDYNYRVLNFTSVLGIHVDSLSWQNIFMDYHDRDGKLIE